MISVGTRELQIVPCENSCYIIFANSKLLILNMAMVENSLTYSGLVKQYIAASRFGLHMGKLLLRDFYRLRV